MIASLSAEFVIEKKYVGVECQRLAPWEINRNEYEIRAFFMLQISWEKLLQKEWSDDTKKYSFRDNLCYWWYNNNKNGCILQIKRGNTKYNNQDFKSV